MKTTCIFPAMHLRFALAILALVLSVQHLPGQGWYSSNWKHRAPVTVVNSVATQLTDFQVRINLTGGVGGNFDFSKAEPDGRDIRITASDGTTLVNYWIEDWTGSSATIWAKVPSIPASGITTIYLYYGNTTAAGFSSGASTFEFFDDFEGWIKGPAWSAGALLPTPKADLTCAAYNGKLYAIGGYNNTASDPLNETYEYDPLTDSWTVKASMPTRRWGPIGVEFDGKIYVFGGQLSNGTGSNANEIYDPASDTWTVRSSGNPLVIPRYTATGVVHPDIIYFPDGKDGYKYWMAYTPYPPQSMENPSIIRSHDGITWTDAGIINPVIPEGLSGSWNDLENPDPDILYVSSLDKWFMVWDGGDELTNSRKIALAYSSDGKTWTQYDGITVNGNPNPIILSGDDTFGAAWERSGTYSKTCTPTLFFKDGTFYLYYAEEASGNNRGAIGLATFTWDNQTNDILTLARSTANPIISLAADATFKSGGGHIDISWNSTAGTYHMYVARELAGSANYELAFLTSTDMTTWSNQGRILQRGVAGQWDDTHIYRSCPVVNSAGEIVPFEGNVRMYYSAFGQGTVGIGIADISGTGVVEKFEGTGPQPIPTDIAMQGLMGVRYGNKIHLFYRSHHFEYDPLTDTYVRKANVPRQLTWSTCATVGSKIYILGGYSYDAPTDATNVNFEYDPVTDTWTTKAPMPGYRYGITRENPVINGKIYVTHGRQGSSFFVTNFEYNPETDTWRQGQNAETDRDGVGCAVINNKLYVVGGRRDNVGPYGITFNEVYDPAIDSWDENPEGQWVTSGADFVYADASARFSGNYGLVITQSQLTGPFRSAESLNGYGLNYVLDFDWHVSSIGGIGGTRPETEVRLSESPDYWGNVYFYNEAASNQQTLRWFTGSALNHLQYGTRNAWHKASLARNGANHYVTFDGNRYGPLTGSSYGSGTGKFRFGLFYSTTQYIDNVRVRKFALTDPTATVGSEIAGITGWTGAGADNDWNTPENWDNGIPISITDVNIPSGVPMPHITTQNAICRNLAINSDGGLTIEAGGALTVNGDMLNQGILTINSSSVENSGSLIISGTATGPVTYNRFLRPESGMGDRHFFSSPVADLGIAAFRAANTFGDPATSKVSRLWNYDELSGSWPEVTTSSEDFVSGKGYNVDQATGSDGLLRFTGTVVKSASIKATSPYANYNNNPRNSLFDYGKDNPDPLIWTTGRSWTSNYGAGGWNLLGNPFTSAMDANEFIEENTGKFDPWYEALYVYDGNTGQETYKYVAPGVPGWDEDPYWEEGGRAGDKVQAGQGFFVLALYDQLDFVFTPDMQVHSNNVPLLKSSYVEDPWPGIRLNIKYGNENRNTVVVYNQVMTVGADRGYDVGLMSKSSTLEVYTRLTAGDNGVNFTRQALPIPGNEELRVPVGIDFETGGEVTFSAVTIPVAGNRYWLEDRQTGTFTDLAAKSYTVTLPAKSYGTGRFYIISSANTPTGSEKPQPDIEELRIWTYNDKVIIHGPVSEKAACEIYDINGRLLLKRYLTDSESQTVDRPDGFRGVCMVRITDGVKVTTRKVVFL